MNYFPQRPSKHPALTAVRSLAPLRQTLTRDILWNRPLFKAPALANPRVALDPLPFTAARVTRPPQRD
jgi:hypothetical protein